MKPKIAYLKQESIDKARWDACIRESVNGLVYGASWYLDTVCKNWDALVLGDYEAVFPLPFNSKYGLHYSLQPLFCQQLGLFAKAEEHLALLPGFIAAIPKKFLVTKLNLNSHNTGIAATRPRVNYIIDLNQGYDAILKNFSKACRKDVQKAKATGTFVKIGISTAEVMKMVRWNLQDKNILETGQFMLMERLMDRARENDSLETFGVYDETGELCGTAGIMKDHRRLYNVFGGTNQKGRKTYANLRINEHVISTYAGQPMIFDFEGSEIPAVASYFRHFGPTETHYFLYERNLLPWPLSRLVK